MNRDGTGTCENWLEVYSSSNTYLCNESYDWEDRYYDNNTDSWEVFDDQIYFDDVWIHRRGEWCKLDEGGDWYWRCEWQNSLYTANDRDYNMRDDCMCWVPDYKQWTFCEDLGGGRCKTKADEIDWEQV